MLEYERSPRLMAHLPGTTNQNEWNHPTETSSVLHQLLCHREMNEHFEVSVLIADSNTEMLWECAYMNRKLVHPRITKL
jgi:hypothetical protein